MTGAATLKPRRPTGRGMSGSQGFQVDLADLNTLANTNIPFIEQTCTGAETTLKNNAQQDTTIFDETAMDTTLYLGVETTFTETRADLELLLENLASSLGDCAQALREIYRRYSNADGQSATRIAQSGPTR
jgi:hypothetical protein